MDPPSPAFEYFLKEDRTENISDAERSHIVEIVSQAILNPSESSSIPKYQVVNHISLSINRLGY
jgi:hypothetical protein